MSEAKRMIMREGYDKYPGEYDDTKGALLERMVAGLLAEKPDARLITITVQ